MRKYGLIGKNLSHSFSKNYFEEKFKKEQITTATYELFKLDKIEALSELVQQQQKLCGLNVTIPYKSAVIPLLDELDPIAKKVGAVNTITVDRKDNGEFYLKGFNTDIFGFMQSLKPFFGKEHHRALIFGTGGASKAVAFVLKQLDVPFYWVSRNDTTSLQTIQYNDLDRKAIESFPFLINCTPLGMFPNTDEHIPINLEGIGENHLVYDLIYNPEETALLKIAKQKGAITVNGLSMLKLQAEEAWRIWQQ